MPPWFCRRPPSAGAALVAGGRSTGPAARSEHARDLRGHSARVADHVAPAIPEHGFAGNGREVVASEVPKRRVARVCFAAVELDNHPPSPVVHVAVPVTAAGGDVLRVAGSWRQAVSQLHSAPVVQFEWGCDARSRFGENVGHQTAPPMPWSGMQRSAQPIGGGQPSLDRAQHEMGCPFTGLGLALIQERHLQTGPRWRRAGMGDRSRVVAERALQVDADSGLRRDPARSGNADMDRRSGFVEQSGQPKRGAMAGRGAMACVQHRGPHAGMWADRAGERGVDAGPEAAPPAVVDVPPGLCAGKADAQQLRPADNAVLLIGELLPFDGLRGS